VRLENSRRGGLIAFGIVSLMVGALPAASALMAIVLAIRMAFSGYMPPAFYPVIALAIAVYGGVAALFIWAGVASIRCRRWVRPVVVGIAWPTVVASAIAAVGLALVTREAAAAIAQRTPADQFMMYIPGAVILFFGVVCPGAYLWFYSTAAVRRTLATYDPRPSWTERCPLSVFVGCVSLVLGAIATLSCGFAGAVPLFGTVVTVPWSWLLIAGAGVLMVGAAALMYLQSPVGWWVALLVITAGFLSAFVTFCRLGMIEFYRRAGMSGEELEAAARSRTMSGAAPGVFAVLALGICIGYLLGVRRHFVRSEASRDVSLP
jgi:hypothetical protein